MMRTVVILLILVVASRQYPVEDHKSSIASSDEILSTTHETSPSESRRSETLIETKARRFLSKDQESEENQSSQRTADDSFKKDDADLRSGMPEVIDKPLETGERIGQPPFIEKDVTPKSNDESTDLAERMAPSESNADETGIEGSVVTRSLIDDSKRINPGNLMLSSSPVPVFRNSPIDTSFRSGSSNLLPDKPFFPSCPLLDSQSYKVTFRGASSNENSYPYEPLSTILGINLNSNSYPHASPMNTNNSIVSQNTYYHHGEPHSPADIVKPDILSSNSDLYDLRAKNRNHEKNNNPGVSLYTKQLKNIQPFRALPPIAAHPVTHQLPPQNVFLKFPGTWMHNKFLQKPITNENLYLQNLYTRRILKPYYYTHNRNPTQHPNYMIQKQFK